MEANAADQDSSVRLHVRDRVTGELFLVDTGAEISLLPAGKATNRTPSNFKLYAANDTRINTYGGSFRTLHLGLRPLKVELLRRVCTVPDHRGRSLKTLWPSARSQRAQAYRPSQQHVHSRRRQKRNLARYQYDQSCH